MIAKQKGRQHWHESLAWCGQEWQGCEHSAVVPATASCLAETVPNTNSYARLTWSVRGSSLPSLLKSETARGIMTGCLVCWPEVVGVDWRVLML